MNQINNLKTKIQDLIDKAVNINNQQKTLLNFLFSKLEEVKELETLEKLKEYENGKYLRAYLFYQSIKRANYQPEHLKLTNLENIDKCLEMIEKDLEANQPKEKTPKKLTDEQLLIMLGEKIRNKEIEGLYTDFSSLHIRKYPGQAISSESDNRAILTLYLRTGKIKPDPAEKFLKKHGTFNKMPQGKALGIKNHKK